MKFYGACVKVLSEILENHNYTCARTTKNSRIEQDGTVSYQYYIDYKDKTEYIKHENRLVTEPIGALLFSVVDRDWDAMAEHIAQVRQSTFRMDQVQECVEELKEELSHTHLFLQRDFERLNTSGDVLYAMYHRAKDYARLREDLLRLIGQVLDLDGENRELTVLQRYFLLNKTDAEARRFKQKMHEQLKVFQCMMCGEDEEHMEVTRETVGDLRLEAAICYASDDLRTLAFMEFEYMVTENLGVRRCENCGKYFLPFSVVSRFCDRIGPDGKTCKEHAIRVRYNEKLQADTCRAAYVKNNNAYQMRVRRDPESWPQKDYLLWKAAAREALDAAAAGKLSEDKCLERVALPERR